MHAEALLGAAPVQHNDEPTYTPPVELTAGGELLSTTGSIADAVTGGISKHPRTARCTAACTPRARSRRYGNVRLTGLMVGDRIGNIRFWSSSLIIHEMLYLRTTPNMLQKPCLFEPTQVDANKNESQTGADARYPSVALLLPRLSVLLSATFC